MPTSPRARTTCAGRGTTTTASGALAERSVLADAAQGFGRCYPSPTPVREMAGGSRSPARLGGFHAGDYARLKARFGTNWVLIERPAHDGMDCPYGNNALLVCRVP